MESADGESCRCVPWGRRTVRNLRETDFRKSASECSLKISSMLRGEVGTGHPFASDWLRDRGTDSGFLAKYRGWGHRVVNPGDEWC